MKTKIFIEEIPFKLYQGFYTEYNYNNPFLNGGYRRCSVYKTFLGIKIKLIERFAIMEDGKKIQIKIN